MVGRPDTMLCYLYLAWGYFDVAISSFATVIFKLHGSCGSGCLGAGHFQQLANNYADLSVVLAYNTL